MLINVLDAEGFEKQVYWKSQQNPTDKSGTIAVTDQNQVLMAANADRAGFLFQNNGIGSMRINDVGNATASNAFVIPPGGSFPPKYYPIPTTAISISGSAGDAFTAREW